MKIRKMDEDVYILAIESSCDETAAAVVKNGREVLSNVISSQIALHTLYGGVVPEIASRKHIEKINQVIREALKEASMTLEEMTAIAVTYGPGLVGALLVGVAEAKAIAYAAKKPLVGVHHIEGHVSANFIEDMVAYINEHLAGPLTLEELASQASLSPFYFSRLFKKETGFTPHGYVITARVNNAKFLLKSSNATIKEICFGTGFTSESSFCTTVKKITGSTPSEYRERICQ